jgi:hypothetical protein
MARYQTQYNGKNSKMLLEVFAACSAGMRRNTEWVV